MIIQYEKKVLDRIEQLVNDLRKKYMQTKDKDIKQLLNKAEEIRIHAYYQYSQLLYQKNNT